MTRQFYVTFTDEQGDTKQCKVSAESKATATYEAQKIHPKGTNFVEVTEAIKLHPLFAEILGSFGMN